MMKQDHKNLHNDDFDEFLRAQLQQAQAYVADDDFTLKLMTKLPAQKKLSVWQERMIILVPLIFISVLVLSQFSVLAILIKLWALVISANVAGLLQIGLLVTIASVCGASFWFAKQSKLI